MSAPDLQISPSEMTPKPMHPARLIAIMFGLFLLMVPAVLILFAVHRLVIWDLAWFQGFDWPAITSVTAAGLYLTFVWPLVPRRLVAPSAWRRVARVFVSRDERLSADGNVLKVQSRNRIFGIAVVPMALVSIYLALNPGTFEGGPETDFGRKAFLVYAVILVAWGARMLFYGVTFSADRSTRVMHYTFSGILITTRMTCSFDDVECVRHRECEHRSSDPEMTFPVVNVEVVARGKALKIAQEDAGAEAGVYTADHWPGAMGLGGRIAKHLGCAVR